MTTEAKKYLTAREVADLLNVHYETVLRMIRRGELRALKVGRDYRIPADALNELEAN